MFGLDGIIKIPYDLWKMQNVCWEDCGEREMGGGGADKSKESWYFFQYVYVLSRTQVFLHLTKRFHFAPFYLIKFDLIGHWRSHMVKIYFFLEIFFRLFIEWSLTVKVGEGHICRNLLFLEICFHLFIKC